MGRTPGRAAGGRSTPEILHECSFHSAGVSGSKSVFRSYSKDRQVSQEALLATQGYGFPGFAFDNRPCSLPAPSAEHTELSLGWGCRETGSGLIYRGGCVS